MMNKINFILIWLSIHVCDRYDLVRFLNDNKDINWQHSPTWIKVYRTEHPPGYDIIWFDPKAKSPENLGRK